MPFDNIRIGGFYNIVQRVSENDGKYIMYEKFRDTISDENAEWKKTLSSRSTVTA